jgi:hypothetical protein
MNVADAVGLAGRIKMVATRPDGTTRIVADWFNNLILDAGLNRIGTGSMGTHAQVGTGSTAPVNADTALQTRIANSSSVLSTTTAIQASAPYYGSLIRTFRFNTGVAAGNLSEVGIGWATSGSLFSRALIKDGNGDPTTITILSDETLDVIYELRFYPPATDSTFDLTLAGVTYNCTRRAGRVTTNQVWNQTSLLDGGGSAGAVNFTSQLSGNNVHYYTGAIGAITGQPSGTIASAPNATTASTYSNNSYVRDGVHVCPLASGNLAGGIRSAVFFTNIGEFQVEFSPNIPKDAAKVLTLNLRVSWARKTL